MPEELGSSILKVLGSSHRCFIWARTFLVAIQLVEPTFLLSGSFHLSRSGAASRHRLDVKKQQETDWLPRLRMIRRAPRRVAHGSTGVRYVRSVSKRRIQNGPARATGTEKRDIDYLP